MLCGTMRRFVFATTLLLVPLPGQKPAPNATASYLPLAPGAEWVYECTDGRNPTVELRWRSTRPIDAPKKSGRCWEIRVRRGTYRSWEYWGARADGIYQHPRRSLGPMRGVSARKPTRWIPGPIGATTKWKWTDTGSVQTSGGGPGPSAEELRMQYEGRIVSMAEKVAVPAGTFTAVRVEISMQSEWFGNSKETLWIVRGTGIVKRVIADSNRTQYTHSLKRYKPGRDPNETTQQRIDKLLAKDLRFAGEKRPKRTIEIQHHVLKQYSSSAFLYGRSNRKVVMFRDYEGQATVFDPLSLEDWNRVIREEIGTPTHRDVTGLGRVFALLAALQLNPDCKPKLYMARNSNTPKSFGIGINTTLDNGMGRRVSRWAQFSVERNGKMKALKF